MIFLLVTILPSGKSIETSGNENLLSVIRRADPGIAAPCGGRGRCGKCLIKPVSGRITSPEPGEIALLGSRYNSGLRLACCAYPLTDCVLNIDAQGLDTSAKSAPITLPEGFSPDAARPGKYGVAFDLGTTSVAAVLWELGTGRFIASSAGANPQAAYGADIVSRMAFACESDENTGTLRTAITACMTELALKAAETAGISPDRIVKVTVAGNTAMSHFFLGRSTRGLATAPFSPAFHGPVTLSAVEAGLGINPAASVYLMPNMQSHVGSDITAGLLFSRPDLLPGKNIFVDIGTNGEIAALEGGKTLICSTAAGPAFEGAEIKCGMRAAPGAVSDIAFRRNRLITETVSGSAPAGICGSGLINIMAFLLKWGLCDKTGHLKDRDEAEETGVPPALAGHLRENAGAAEFLIYKRESGDIVITQNDIRAVQLVKSAIRSGIDILSSKLPGEISRLIVAGAFGSYINPANAVKIGLFPDIPPDKISFTGNAAAAGASMVLLSRASRDECEKIAENAVHVELGANSDFQQLYINNMLFP